ncbi:hypothetical protein HBI26_135380 [Parastagonospora nodorum]|nr:hypothetical protein HBH49_112340 [Parastagonospora nodorum]KAH4849054.1 hypothetical protein HBH75_148010 [Parastagonospora nodorum]KAH4938789.1 hypothetical protein HBI79_058540 [Parastagonospora nodorum]KAH5028201.1 hypothetical protein HBI74_117890 [Parastagonospora nodorum]KAH5078869.1 hypothetical protein HBH95_088140 [Parastagonospora nodorum]
MMAKLLRKAQILHARALKRTETATNCMAQLKCDRQHPSCHRCTKRLVACNYSAPQDRKQIAARRRAARRLQGETTDLPGNSYTDLSASICESPSVSTGTRREAMRAPVDGFTPATLRTDNNPCFSTSHIARLLSQAIGFMLLEVYFERIYNATLLFDKAAFFCLHINNKVLD